MSRPLNKFCSIVADIVRRNGNVEQNNLSARQLAIFAIVYTSPELQTVRGLAADLKISKPAITRSLNRLEDDGLLKRQDDIRDGRSIILIRTQQGTQYARVLDGFIRAADKAAAAEAEATQAQTQQQQSLQQAA